MRSLPHSHIRGNQVKYTDEQRTMYYMTTEELESIRSWDRRCGDNEGTFFPVTLDRRRLLKYVDELRAELAALTCERQLDH
jgi:hypothetical protein